MNRFRAGLAAALILAAQPAFAQEPAMRLEALGERMAKLNAQVGQGVLAERSRRALQDAARDFDAALRATLARPAGPEVHDNYLLLRLLWQDYRPWVLKPPSRENAKRIADRVEELSWVAAKGTQLAIAPGRRGTGRLALDASQAATLSQRVARLYLLRHWGVRDAAIDRQLEESSSGLRATLARLRDAPFTTPEIETELQVAEGQVGFLLRAADALEGGAGGLREMEFIAKAGDHIFESMQRAARLYEGLAP